MLLRYFISWVSCHKREREYYYHTKKCDRSICLETLKALFQSALLQIREAKRKVFLKKFKSAISVNPLQATLWLLLRC